MPDYIQEQIVVLLTTTLSLLTAWSWNSVLQEYLEKYYDKSLKTRILAAVIVTIATFTLISWILNYFQLHEDRLARARKYGK